jgi:hypothetical protein
MDNREKVWRKMTTPNFDSLVREIKGLEGDIWPLVKNNDPYAIMDRLRLIRKRLEPYQRIKDDQEF